MSTLHVRECVALPRPLTFGTPRGVVLGDSGFENTAWQAMLDGIQGPIGPSSSQRFRKPPDASEGCALVNPPCSS